MEELIYHNAVKVVIQTLRDDPEMYYGFQSNIAMAFYDALYKTRGYSLPTDHDMVNTAAKNFLNMFIMDSVGGESQADVLEKLLNKAREKAMAPGVHIEEVPKKRAK